MNIQLYYQINVTFLNILKTVTLNVTILLYFCLSEHNKLFFKNIIFKYLKCLPGIIPIYYTININRMTKHLDVCVSFWPPVK